MKKIIPIIIALVIVGGGGAFYGGMKYQESKSPFFQGDRGEAIQRGIREGMPGVTRERTGAGLLLGEVIAKDEQSLTLKTSDGSSRIVFFSQATEISKMTEGSLNDIETGKQITVIGQQNPDGSYTADTIQLTSRPLIPRGRE